MPETLHSVADFRVILSQGPVVIGDSNPVFEREFGLGPVSHGHLAVLMFNVQHLTHTHREGPVLVNGDQVGVIHPYSGEFETASNWYTQILTFSDNSLSEGANELQVGAIRLDPDDTTPSNVFDDFRIRNTVLMYRRDLSGN